ncbi:MFS transporter [Streptomyces bluensis]|uniref:MFS transporter n=1 Tax=Streptomyces bluensis TaxID=33897 RepID=UPI00331F6046
MRPEELHRARRTPERAQVIDGLRYLSARRDLIMPLVLLAIIGTFGFNFQLALPLMAKTEFHADAGSFGLLTVALAVGSLCAAFATTARRGRPSARTVPVAAIAFGSLEAAAGWAPTCAAALVLLVPTGFATLWFTQATNHRVQLGTDPRYRGRVMALHTLILQGSTPLGALFVGLLAEEAGARSGLRVGGLVALAAGLAVVAAERRQRGRGPDEPDLREADQPPRTSVTQ